MGSRTLGGPKDIPDTVIEASAASCEVASFLHSSRFQEVKEKNILRREMWSLNHYVLEYSSATVE